MGKSNHIKNNNFNKNESNKTSDKNKNPNANKYKEKIMPKFQEKSNVNKNEFLSKKRTFKKDEIEYESSDSNINYKSGRTSGKSKNVEGNFTVNYNTLRRPSDLDMDVIETGEVYSKFTNIKKNKKNDVYNINRISTSESVSSEESDESSIKINPKKVEKINNSAKAVSSGKYHKLQLELNESSDSANKIIKINKISVDKNIKSNKLEKKPKEKTSVDFIPFTTESLMNEEQKQFLAKDKSEEIPWMTDEIKKAYAYHKLHLEIIEFYELIKPTESENLLREQTIKILKTSISEEFPNWKIKAFGSYPVGLHLPDSDIDLVVIVDDINIPEDAIFTKLKILMQKKKLVRYVQIIKANKPLRIPLMKNIFNIFFIKGFSFDYLFIFLSNFKGNYK